MRFRVLISITLLMSLFCIYSCHSKNQETAANDQQKHIIVYGSNTCPHCINFKAKLDSVGLTYTFKDVYAENENNDAEMLEKLQQAGFNRYVKLPVVDIEGKIMMRPELQELLKEL